jgi:hypothetical protein
MRKRREGSMRSYLLLLATLAGFALLGLPRSVHACPS